MSTDTSPAPTMPDDDARAYREEGTAEVTEAARLAARSLGALMSAAQSFVMAGDAERADWIERIITDLAEMADQIAEA